MASAMQPQKETDAVQTLLKDLQTNLNSTHLSTQQQIAALERLKVLGRDVRHAGPIFTKSGISIISSYGLESDQPSISKEALRCLANALLLNEQSRQIFIELGCVGKAVDRLKNDDRDDEFLISRILFLLTYKTKLDFAKLIDEHDLHSSINRNIARHAERYSPSGKKGVNTPPIMEMAMHETLKLLFNITYHYAELVSAFAPSLHHLIHILLNCEIHDSPLRPPVTLLINALLNLDLNTSIVESDTESNEGVSTDSRTYGQLVNRLVFILDSAIKAQSEKELDQAAAPLCTLLRHVYASNNLEAQTVMRKLLLPAENERALPLGQGKSLPSRLLRMSCSPELPSLRDNISGLLFELSDKNASKFIENIGYGYASGYLMSHQIPVPANTNSEEASGSARPSPGVAYNPVTGQRLSEENEASAHLPEMTEEEKEREAERLFVLFERLKATGVMNVTNPVEQAIHEGRFEELD